MASAPALWLNERGKLKGRKLDYGCGHGKDAERFNMDRYDPYFFPESLTGQYDTVLCTYVLNIVDETEQWQVLNRLLKYVEDDGCIYITVRRDIPKEGTETQRWVELEYPFTLVRETPGYAIYKWDGTEP